jgi:hypothetical protein
MRLLWNPTVMTFDFIVPEMEKSEGVQKVGGFSRGWHQWNSVRLGIRKENDYCVLYLYAYIKGKLIVKRLGGYTYLVGDKIKCILKWKNSQVDVIANDDFATWHFNPFTPCKLSYQLYPYAETDGTKPKRVPLNIKLNNVVIR